LLESALDPSRNKLACEPESTVFELAASLCLGLAKNHRPFGILKGDGVARDDLHGDEVFPSDEGQRAAVKRNLDGAGERLCVEPPKSDKYIDSIAECVGQRDGVRTRRARATSSGLPLRLGVSQPLGDQVELREQAAMSQERLHALLRAQPLCFGDKRPPEVSREVRTHGRILARQPLRRLNAHSF
jgi:hypothetical protein